MQITKKKLRISLGVVLLVLLVIIVVQNSVSVKLAFFTASIQLPLFVVVLASATVGLAVGWLLRARR